MGMAMASLDFNYLYFAGFGSWGLFCNIEGDVTKSCKMMVAFSDCKNRLGCVMTGVTPVSLSFFRSAFGGHSLSETDCNAWRISS